jgi:hypothetical protein
MMKLKSALVVSLGVLMSVSAFASDFTGTWKGTDGWMTHSGGETQPCTELMLEIDVTADQVRLNPAEYLCGQVRMTWDPVVFEVHGEELRMGEVVVGKILPGAFNFLISSPDQGISLEGSFEMKGEALQFVQTVTTPQYSLKMGGTVTRQ